MFNSAVVIGTPDVLHALPYLRGLAWFDPHGVTRDAFGVGTPASVLLGTDGELAGGPVAGEEAIVEFVEEIAQHLREAAAPGSGEQPELEAVSDDR